MMRQLDSLIASFESSHDPQLQVEGVSSEGLMLVSQEKLSLFLKQVSRHWRERPSNSSAVALVFSTRCIEPFVFRPTTDFGQRSTAEAISNSSWLLIVPGTASAAEAALDALSLAGAVRPSLLENGWSLDNKLADGSFADVCQLKRTVPVRYGRNNCLAVKVARRHDSENSTSAIRVLLQEVEMLVLMQGHKHIQKLRGVFSMTVNESRYWALASGHFPHYLLARATAHPLREDEAKHMFEGLLDGLVYIHEKGVVHRDITPGNLCLVDSTWAVICGFHAACFVSDERRMRELAGTIGYMAPEVILGKPYDQKVDLFGLGSSLFFALRGKNLFGDSSDEMRHMSRYGGACLTRVDARGLSPELEDFVIQILHPNPSWRLSLKQARAHAWMGGPQEAEDPQELGTRPKSKSRKPPSLRRPLRIQSSEAFTARAATIDGTIQESPELKNPESPPVLRAITIDSPPDWMTKSDGSVATTASPQQPRGPPPGRPMVRFACREAARPSVLHDEVKDTILPLLTTPRPSATLPLLNPDGFQAGRTGFTGRKSSVAMQGCERRRSSFIPPIEATA